MSVASKGIPSFSLISATRSVSCLPPPLVSRRKGMPCSFRRASESAAPGIGFEARRRTPSMLHHVRRESNGLRLTKTHSNANAKLGTGRELGAWIARLIFLRGESVWRCNRPNDRHRVCDLIVVVGPGECVKEMYVIPGRDLWEFPFPHSYNSHRLYGLK
jgi:hypothetical protein